MALFPMLNPPAAGPEPGLFDNLRGFLAQPGVKAGLLQAGMSMLNADPRQSPFSQIFTGVNEGLQANERYKDLVTQREIEKQNLLAEQQREDRKFGLQTALNAARMKQIENSIATSQANTSSLGKLREAQTERARRAPTGRAGTPLTRDSFIRERMKTLLPGDEITPELQAQWDREYQTLAGAGGAAPAPAPGVAGTATLPQVGAADVTAVRQQLMDDYGYTEEEADAILGDVLQ